MDTTDPLVNALIALCKAEGGEKFVADKAAVSAENLTQITKGVKLPSGNPRGVGPGVRAKITKAYPGWLAAPINPYKNPQPIDPKQLLAQDKHGWSVIESVANNALQVPLLENAASMGDGSAMLDGDVLAGHLSLSPQWVSNTLHPSRNEALRFIHGYGDSMTPTFNSGDVLLVDTGVIEVKIDGVYVLSAHERLFIKRVRQRMDGVFEISSDNPTHKTVDLLNGSHAVRVLGRVVWVWNGRRT